MKRREVGSLQWQFRQRISNGSVGGAPNAFPRLGQKFPPLRDFRLDVQAVTCRAIGKVVYFGDAEPLGAAGKLEVHDRRSQRGPAEPPFAQVGTEVECKACIEKKSWRAG